MSNAVAKERESVEISVAESDAEKERVYAFRYQVYVEEIGKTKIASADHARRIITDELDESGILFYAHIGDRILGTVTSNLGALSYPTDKQIEIYGLTPYLERYDASALSFTSRLMVCKDRRGSMILSKIIFQAYENAVRHGARFDFCHCQPSLIHVYQHLGYRRYKDNTIDPETGYRVPLVLIGRDAEFLKAIHSPFSRILRRLPLQLDEREAAAWLYEQFPTARHESSNWLMDEDSYWQYVAKKIMPVSHRNGQILDRLTEVELKTVMRSANILNVSKGDFIIRAGDRGDEMYLLLDGVVEVRESSTQRLLYIFERGQVFGELAFISKLVTDLSPIRSADVGAATDCEILIITQSMIQRVMKNDGQLAAKLAFNLAGILGERLLVNSSFVDGATSEKDWGRGLPTNIS